MSVVFQLTPFESLKLLSFIYLCTEFLSTVKTFCPSNKDRFLNIVFGCASHSCDIILPLLIFHHIHVLIFPVPAVCLPHNNSKTSHSM